MEPRADIYRENHNRAIYLHGSINQELVDKLSPEINRLRLTEATPITVYIDCEGGDITAADNIRDLLKCPDPDGNRCPLVTVCTGTAASAAADFLIMADYAIAHAHTLIMYHGTREQRRQPLTYESARSLASSLQQTNEVFARRLAQRVFKRLALRLCLIQNEFKEYRESEDHKLEEATEKLIKALKRHVLPSTQKLLTEALSRQKSINELTACVGRNFKRRKDIDKMSAAEFESVLLTAIIRYKVRIHAKEKWRISEKGLSEISNDFSLLHDFHFGSQKKDLQNQIDTLGQLFLRDHWREDYKLLTVSDEEKAEWLRQHAVPKMQPIWYFLVSLCRLLQTTDNYINSHEAYWLGLVDEIPGSGLPNLREAHSKTKPNGKRRPKA